MSMERNIISVVLRAAFTLSACSPRATAIPTAATPTVNPSTATVDNVVMPTLAQNPSLSQIVIDTSCDEWPINYKIEAEADLNS